MTAPSGRSAEHVHLTPGAVTGAPRRWLRLDGLVLLAGALGLYATTGWSWWLVPLVLLLPDLFMLGYLGGTRVGAFAYNLGHTYALPVATALTGLATDHQAAVAVGLVWLAHIGMDRALGYGLKYDTAFVDTHLGRIGPGDK